MSYRYCFKCGRKIKANTKFCPFCGAKQTTNLHHKIKLNNHMHNSSRNNFSNPYKLPILVTGIIIILLLVIGGVHKGTQMYHQYKYPTTKLPPSISDSSQKFQGGLKLITNSNTFTFIQGGNDAGTGTHMHYHVDHVSYAKPYIYVDCDYTGATDGSDNGIAHYAEFKFHINDETIESEEPEGGPVSD